MGITQAQILEAGYELDAAPIDDWREYNIQNPVPGYFEFDWLSARHPDLYNKFALSTLGLMDELSTLFDLSRLEVIDIGAGTGRATFEAAKKAKRVIAVDNYRSVITYAHDLLKGNRIYNVHFIQGNSANLPFTENSFDAVICAWAMLNYQEAYRVLKPEGHIIQLGPAPGSLCGELTSILVTIYPDIISAIAPRDQFLLTCPVSDRIIEDTCFNGLTVSPPTRIHDFTYLSKYEDINEAAEILGRLYGPTAKQYMLERRQSSLAWRLRIVIYRIKK